MSDPKISSVIVIEGVEETFESKTEAMNYLRRPKILKALMKATGDNKELSEWLLENQDTVNDAFDSGTIRRVTKAEKKKLDAALKAIVDSGDKAFAFVAENATEISESFRWPKVKRMTDEEKATLAKNTLMAASEDNEELADWVIAHQNDIMEAYAAGKEKREVSPQATIGLTAYREGKAEEKRLKEAGMDPAEAKAAGEALTAKIKAEASVG